MVYEAECWSVGVVAESDTLLLLLPWSQVNAERHHFPLREAFKEVKEGNQAVSSDVVAT